MEQIGVQREGILDNEFWVCKRCGVIWDDPESELQEARKPGKPVKALTYEQLALAVEIVTKFGFIPKPGRCFCNHSDYRYYIASDLKSESGFGVRAYCSSCRKERKWSPLYNVWSNSVPWER